MQTWKRLGLDLAGSSAAFLTAALAFAGCSSSSGGGAPAPPGTGQTVAGLTATPGQALRFSGLQVKEVIFNDTATVSPTDGDLFQIPVSFANELNGPGRVSLKVRLQDDSLISYTGEIVLGPLAETTAPPGTIVENLIEGFSATATRLRQRISSEGGDPSIIPDPVEVRNAIQQFTATSNDLAMADKVLLAELSGAQSLPVLLLTASAQPRVLAPALFGLIPSPAELAQRFLNKFVGTLQAFLDAMQGAIVTAQQLDEILASYETRLIAQTALVFAGSVVVGSTNPVLGMAIVAGWTWANAEVLNRLLDAIYNTFSSAVENAVTVGNRVAPRATQSDLNKGSDQVRRLESLLPKIRTPLINAYNKLPSFLQFGSGADAILNPSGFELRAPVGVKRVAGPNSMNLHDYMWVRVWFADGYDFDSQAPTVATSETPGEGAAAVAGSTIRLRAFQRNGGAKRTALRSITINVP